MKKREVKMVGSINATLLFRRRCATPPSRPFREQLVADAVREAVRMFGTVEGALTGHLVVTHGTDEKFDANGHRINRPPRYCWTRVETAIVSENGAVPQRFARNKAGLLKPIHI